VKLINIFQKEILNNKVRRQFFTYIIIGGFAAFIDFALLFFLTSIMGVYYILSTTIAYPVGALTHFFLNKYLNFKIHDRNLIHQLLIYVIINIFGLGLTLGIMYIFVEFFNLWYLLAKVIAILIVVFYSFNMHKSFTFKEKW